MAAWSSRLKLFLQQFLQEIIPPDILPKFFTPLAMQTWERAFTHESLSLTNSYEDLEYLGDALLKGAFAKYLMARFPHFNKADYTELNVAYMSEVGHDQLSRKLGFTDLVRTIDETTEVNIHVSADIFESFFGALDKICDVASPGNGFNYCYNIIVSIFRTEPIREDKRYGSPKTQVQQMFSRFGLGKPQVSNQPPYYQVILTPQQINFLKTYGVIIENPVIGEAVSKTEKGAEMAAYTRALELLNSKGISTRWAILAKRAYDLSFPEMQPYLSAARARLARDGYKEMYFHTPRTMMTSEQTLIQLIGTDGGRVNRILGSIYGPTGKEDHHRAEKIALIRQYSQNQ